MIITSKDGRHGFLKGVNGYRHSLGATMLKRLIESMGCAGLLCAAGAFFSGNTCATESITLKNGEEVRCDIIERQEGGYRVRPADGTTKVFAKSSIDGLVHEDDNPVCKLPMKQEETASEPERKVELAVPKAEPKAMGGPVNTYKGDMPRKILFGENPDVREAMSALEELLAKDTLPPKGDEPADYMAAARAARARGDWDNAILNTQRQIEEFNRFGDKDSNAQLPFLYCSNAANLQSMLRDFLRQYDQKIDLKPAADKAGEYLNATSDFLQKERKGKRDPVYGQVYDQVYALRQNIDGLVRRGLEGGGVGGRIAGGSSGASGSSAGSGSSGGASSPGIDPNQLLDQLYRSTLGKSQAEKAAAIRAGAELLKRAGKKSQ
jgi:hypothetical protein